MNAHTLMSFAMLLLFPSLLIWMGNYRSISFQIHEESTLFIEGSSNVNKFKCSCQCISKDQHHLKLKVEDNPLKAHFQDNQIQISVEELDCGRKAMNKDLYHALNADEHPYITIQLLHAKSFGDLKLGRHWENYLATTSITIAGCNKLVEMHVQGKQLNSGQYHFQGSQLLKMTDFGLEPPTPFMGLIKVKNDIRIYLDLIVTIKE